jgi:hypothetical protein
MLNNVTLIGNLGQDPDTRFSAAGLAICNLNIAVSQFYKDQSGESQKRTHWFRATAFGRTAEVAQQYLPVVWPMGGGLPPPGGIHSRRPWKMYARYPGPRSSLRNRSG